VEMPFNLIGVYIRNDVCMDMRHFFIETGSNEKVFAIWSVSVSYYEAGSLC
jgi:hypothetical protein